MTSAHKMRRSKRLQRRAGFTLLEIMITMVIVSVLLGSAILFLAERSNGELEKLAQKTQILAKETLRNAKLQQRPFSIIISHKEIWAQPENWQLDDQNQPSANPTLDVPEGISISLSTHSDDEWFTLDKSDPPFIWTFTQSGICDPLEIRFENDGGIQTIAFHSLTAGEIINAE